MCDKLLERRGVDSSNFADQDLDHFRYSGHIICDYPEYIEDFLPWLKDALTGPSVGDHIPANSIPGGVIECVQRSITDKHSDKPFPFLNLEPDILDMI